MEEKSKCMVHAIFTMLIQLVQVETVLDKVWKYEVSGTLSVPNLFQPLNIIFLDFRLDQFMFAN